MKTWKTLGVCALCLFVLLISTADLRAQQTYSLAETAEVRISGTSTLRDWTVRGKELTGQLTFTPNGKGKGGAGTIVSAEIALPVASILSERGATMDNKVHQALKGDEHPIIRFELRKPVELRPDRAEYKVTADGVLSIAGVSRAFTFDMVLSRKDGIWTFSGKKAAKMSDFDVEPPSAMFGQIVTDNEIEIELSLVFHTGSQQP